MNKILSLVLRSGHRSGLVAVDSEEGSCAREKKHRYCRSTWKGHQPDLSSQEKASEGKSLLSQEKGESEGDTGEGKSLSKE